MLIAWRLPTVGRECFTLGDGHAEIKKWTDGRTAPPYNKDGDIGGAGGLPWGIASPNNLDLFWLQQRTTGFKREDGEAR